MEYDPDRNWREIDDAGFNAHIGPLWYSKVDETSSQVALKLDQRHTGEDRHKYSQHGSRKRALWPIYRR